MPVGSSRRHRFSLHRFNFVGFASRISFFGGQIFRNFGENVGKLGTVIWRNRQHAARGRAPTREAIGRGPGCRAACRQADWLAGWQLTCSRWARVLGRWGGSQGTLSVRCCCLPACPRSVDRGASHPRPSVGQQWLLAKYSAEQAAARGRAHVRARARARAS